MDTGLEKTFTRVDITDADDDIAGQQHLFDGCAAIARLAMKKYREIIRSQWLNTQTAQQGVRLDIAFRLRMPEHRAEAARVSKPHDLRAQQQIEMIMFLGRMTFRQHAQVTGHAQMNDQRAVREMNQEIFTAPARRQHTLAFE